jgi:uncharacterized protein (DUF1501 family)
MTDPTRISRRTLLTGTAGVVLGGGTLSAILLGCDDSEGGGAATVVTTIAPTPTTTVTAITPEPSVAPAGDAPADNVLVVLQLSGGNDALDTLVPLQGAYHDLRPTLGQVDAELIPIPGTTAFGLHPALAPLRPLLDAGRVGIVAGIGFERPDRSHFQALDMWWTGTPGAASTTGWLGRWLDATTTAPAATLRSVALGNGVPALRAATVESVVVIDPARFAIDATPQLTGAWAALGPGYAEALAATRTFARIQTPIADQPDGGAAAGATGDIAAALLVAAALIAAEPATRLVHVSVTGFDTHAAESSRHTALLGDLATGLAGFQSALSASGDATRTLLVTTSEFGRRAAENGSGGTDHGKAGVQFVVGSPVTALGVHGQMDLTDLDDGDLRPVIDPRSMYATALDWVGPTAVTDHVLGASFDRLPFLG